jgi:hypothetical protein
MKTIATAKEYFDEVVGYNLEAYKAKLTSLPAAYNLANTLFSMHEWVWDSYGNKLEPLLEVKLGNKGALNAHMQSKCPAFNYMRDVANASKHVTLTKNPSTQATHIKNTAVTGWGESGFGMGNFGGSIMIDDGGTKVGFENKADEVHKYWKTLLDKL